MQFWQTLFGSFTNLDAYKNVVAFPLRTSLWFVIRFYLLLMFIAGISVFFIARAFATQIAHAFPQEASLRFESSHLLASGLELPWKVSLPFNTKMAVFEDHVAFDSNGQEFFSAPLSQLLPNTEPFIITANDVKQHAQQTLPTAATMTVVFIVIMIAIGRIFSSFVHAVFFSWILAMFGIRMTFSKLAQLMFHIAVAAEGINLVSLLIYRNLAVPIYELAFLGITLLVLRSLRRPFA